MGSNRVEVLIDVQVRREIVPLLNFYVTIMGFRILFVVFGGQRVRIEDCITNEVKAIDVKVFRISEDVRADNFVGTGVANSGRRMPVRVGRNIRVHGKTAYGIATIIGVNGRVCGIGREGRQNDRQVDIRGSVWEQARQGKEVPVRNVSSEALRNGRGVGVQNIVSVDGNVALRNGIDIELLADEDVDIIYGTVHFIMDVHSSSILFRILRTVGVIHVDVLDVPFGHF